MGGTELYRSRSGGSSFTNVMYGLPPSPSSLVHADMDALAFDSSGRLWIGTDGGMYRTPDLGASWADLNTNLSVTEFYGIFEVPGEVCGGSQDNGLAIYSGSLAWAGPAGGGDAGQCAIDPTNSSTIYMTVKAIPVWKSTAGADFAPAVAGIDPTDPRAYIGPLEMDRANPQILFFGTDRVYGTTDGASTWNPVSQHLACQNQDPSLPCYLIALGVGAAGDVGPTVYAMTNSGLIYANVLGSGQAWSVAALPFDTTPSLTFGDIDVSPYKPYLADAVGGDLRHYAGRIVATTDSGADWTDITGSLAALPVYSIATDWSTYPATLFAGTESGVYWSNDSGTTWNYATGFLHTRVLDLQIDPVSRMLYAATYGRGVFVAPLN